MKSPEDWKLRRQEILATWHKEMGKWPALLERPKLERLSSERREDFDQARVRVQVAETQHLDGYLLTPPGNGPFPAALVVFYDPETSIGQAKNRERGALRDFAYQLTKRGFVTLSIGSPGGDARKPDTAGNVLQPLSYLAYVAANCHTALSQLPNVDAERIGVLGHSYGGKWAMFAAALHEPFAAGAWSDPGIAFDEKRANVNYWEPWYLGLDPSSPTRKPGVPTKENPRTGAYKRLVEAGHDLHEIQALLCPRPFMVSGGSEDPVERWVTLNHAVAVNRLLGHESRIAFTTRPKHDPTEQSNAQLFAFLEHFLRARK